MHRAFHTLVLVSVTLGTLTTVSNSARADDSPSIETRVSVPVPERDGEVIADTATYPPILSPDALITDDGEAGVPPGGEGSGLTCSYETVQTAVNPAPSAPSFVLLYVVPSDSTPSAWLDTPRSCSDNSVRYSAIAKASRNFASFLAQNAAGVNYRVQNITYTHNYNGVAYATRGVRRFRSKYSRYEWDSLKMNATPSPRLDRLTNELTVFGFRTASTKYAAVLDAAAEVTTCNANGCGHTVGITTYGGNYAFTTRHFNDDSTVKVRYGCNTDGDAYLAHENTHQLAIQHVTDYPDDLMVAAKPNGVNFNTPSRRLQWDYNGDGYSHKVAISPYVAAGNLAVSYFQDCSAS